MRKLARAATAVAASGLTALGAVAGVALTSGAADAAQNVTITHCSLGSSAATVNVAPTCTAATGTIHNVVSIKVTTNPTFFTAIENIPGIDAILALLGEPLAVRVTYTLACNVNGGIKTANESFVATKSSGTQQQVVNLATAVGSPAPSQCQVRQLTATSLLALNSTILAALQAAGLTFTFGVTATGDNGTPGGIWAQYPKDAKSAGGSVCADVIGNGNAGSRVRAFQCESDLADQWLQAPTGQFVHNGDCLADSHARAIITRCLAKPTIKSGQIWASKNPNAKHAEFVNKANGQCLTAPTKKPVDTTQLRIAKCKSGDIGQLWKVPPKTPL